MVTVSMIYTKMSTLSPVYAKSRHAGENRFYEDLFGVPDDVSVYLSDLYYGGLRDRLHEVSDYRAQ